MLSAWSCSIELALKTDEVRNNTSSTPGERTVERFLTCLVRSELEGWKFAEIAESDRAPLRKLAVGDHDPEQSLLSTLRAKNAQGDCWEGEPAPMERHSCAPLEVRTLSSDVAAQRAASDTQEP